MIPQTRRVAVLGGTRIPFCKRDTAYADLGNFGMSVEVLGALVEKFDLHGLELGEVAFGAVMKHPADWNLAREAPARPYKNSMKPRRNILYASSSMPSDA